MFSCDCRIPLPIHVSVLTPDPSSSRTCRPPWVGMVWGETESIILHLPNASLSSPLATPSIRRRNNRASARWGRTTTTTTNVFLTHDILKNLCTRRQANVPLPTTWIKHESSVTPTPNTHTRTLFLPRSTFGMRPSYFMHMSQPWNSDNIPARIFHYEAGPGHWGVVRIKISFNGSSRKKSMLTREMHPSYEDKPFPLGSSCSGFLQSMHPVDMTYVMSLYSPHIELGCSQSQSVRQTATTTVVSRYCHDPNWKHLFGSYQHTQR